MNASKSTVCICAVYATQHLSGGHLNPAISIAMAVSGHMHWLKSLLYVGAQVSGEGHLCACACAYACAQWDMLAKDGRNIC